MATPEGEERETDFSNQVPIGRPLLGTKLELQDKDGGDVTNGYGEIWIGKDQSVMLLQHWMTWESGNKASTQS